MRALTFVSILALAGCTTSGTPPAATTVTPTVATICLPLKTYTAAEQKAVADELAKLPADNPLVGFVADYGAMRAADRACLASH